MYQICEFLSFFPSTKSRKFLVKDVDGISAEFKSVSSDLYILWIF